MSSRERWTVYPLLFLTLGIALKDKVTREITTKDLRSDRVQCKTVLITDNQGKPQVVLGHVDRRVGLMFVDAAGNIVPSIAIPSAPSRPQRPGTRADGPAGDPASPADSGDPSSVEPPGEEAPP